MQRSRSTLLLVSAMALIFGHLVPHAMCQKSADVYVATNGNDNWSGSLAAPNSGRTDGPVATLEKARRVVQKLKASRHNTAIMVMLRQGTYFLEEPLKLSSSDSGTADAPVMYQAYPGEKPVISGGQRIDGWKVSGGTWTVKLDPTRVRFFEQLFVNEERRYRPRTTKEGYLYNAGPVFVDSQAETCRPFAQQGGGYECFDRFRFKPGDLQSNYSNMNDVEIIDFEKWTVPRMRLKSVDTSSGIAYLTGPTFQNPENQGFIRGHRYLVENVKEALSQPGEWYLDRSVSPWLLTYLAHPGENPDKDIVTVPQQPQLIVADQLSYVTFKGLTFAHDDWVVPPEGHAGLQAEPNVSAALSFRSSHNVTIDSCTITHTSGWGLEFVSGDGGPSHENRVMNSVLYDLGTGGIRIGARYQRGESADSVPHGNLVEGNLIASGGRFLPAGIGMGVWIGNSPHNIVTHNEIYDFYGGGIGVCVPTPEGCPYPHDNTISFNHIYQQGRGVTSDLAGVYLATYDSPGNKVFNNWIHDVTHNFQDPDGYGGEGIYLDNFTSNVLVKNNLVYRVSQSTIFNHDGGNNTYDNNILAYGHLAIIQTGGLGELFRQQGGQQQRRGGGNRGPFGGGPFGGSNEPFGGQRRQRPGNSPQPGRQPAGQEAVDPDKPAFYFTHNIVIWDRGAIQRTPGIWLCQHPTTKQDVPCPARFQFNHNLYWHPEGKAPVFATTDPENPRQPQSHSFNGWQRMGEDEDSVNESPGFVDPRYPADDFGLRSTGVAEKIGFIPFDPKQAGPTTRLPRPPKQPSAFPVQMMEPSDY